MRRVAAAAWVLTAVLAAVAPVVRAQDAAADLYGRVVTALRFEVEGRPDTSPALPALVTVAAGKPLTLQDVRTSEEHLGDRYDGVSVVAAPTPGGVDVTFQLVPRHPVNKLTVIGDAGIAPDTLRDQVLQWYGGVPADERPADVAVTARQILNDDGYLDAAVAPRLDLQHAPEGATLTLIATAGSLAHIAHVDVQSSVLTPAEVIDRTHTATGQPYRRRAIDTALTAIEDDLHARGYYEAQATQDVTATAAAGVTLRIVVDPGPLVRLVVDPPASLPGPVDSLIPINRERSVDQDLLEDSQGRIKAALKDQGYWKADVSFRTDNLIPAPGSTELVVTFHITRGARYRVDRIVLPDNLSLPAEAIRKDLAVAPGDIFSETRFLGGLAVLVEDYRRHGYYQARTDPAYDVASNGAEGQALVTITPNITEGPRGVVRGVSVAFQGAHQLSDVDLTSIMRSKTGAPYVAADVAADKERLVTTYLDRGFLNADVTVTPTFDAGGTSAALVVTVSEGPQVRVAEISIAGNARVSTSQIREDLGISVGDALGASALRAAQNHLEETDSFRRVSIAVDRLTDGTTARLVVTVVEAAATTIGFGGGLEGGTYPRSVEGGGIADKLAISPDGLFDIERRNLGGRNRSLDFYSRVSLRPRDAPGDPTKDGKGYVPSEYNFNTTYRERRAFETDTDLLFSGTAQRGVQTTFSYASNSLSTELLHRLTPRLNFSGRYALQFTQLFNERISAADELAIDRLFPQVRLSILSTGASWDSRDSPLAPTRGSLLTADASLAARDIGSEVGFVKTFFQASGFYALDASKRTVVALRAELGAAHGFPRAGVVDANGLPSVALPASERFFAGGSNSVRGFQEDRLGVLGIIDPATGLSQGGNGVIVLNAEVRRVVSKLFGRNFEAVGFLDGGNVFKDAVDVDVTAIRGAIGFGARYDSKLGPIRLDFGFKLNHQAFDDQPWEYHLSIGEAF